jgi:hypothetical protein
MSCRSVSRVAVSQTLRSLALHLEWQCSSRRFCFQAYVLWWKTDGELSGMTLRSDWDVSTVTRTLLLNKCFSLEKWGGAQTKVATVQTAPSAVCVTKSIYNDLQINPFLSVRILNNHVELQHFSKFEILSRYCLERLSKAKIESHASR